MTWQFNIRCWQWPWHSKTVDIDLMIFSHFAGIGPFQFHWYSSLSLWERQFVTALLERKEKAKFYANPR